MKTVEKTTPENKTQININGQYIKNLSFDCPLVPEVFSKLKEPPKVDLNLDLQVQNKDNDSYEVTLVLKVKALCDIETVFTANLSYAGLFQIKDVIGEEQKKQILMVYCPNLLFPFARSVLATVSREAGFQPLMINPVDFASLYMQQNTNDKQANDKNHVVH